MERRLPKGGLTKATGFTHTSVHAHDLDESVRFYRELFGMEEIPAPDFPFPVRWLRLGDLQLHLFQSDEAAPRGHHFGVDVDDFEAAYEKAGEMDVRDPAGNMVEVNWPDASMLDRSLVTEEIYKVEPETAESARATLYP